MAASREPRRHWRSEDEPDPLRPLNVLSWRMFLALPILVVVSAVGLTALSIAIGSTLVTVFLFSFAIMTPVALFVSFRQVARWIAQVNSNR